MVLQWSPRRGPWQKPSLKQSAQATCSITATAYSAALNVGSYSVTGQGITVALARNVALSAGSYAVSGQGIQVALARKYALSVGSYALVGQSITATYVAGASAFNYASSLNAGAYSVNGQSTTVALARKTALNAGSYSVAGKSITATVGRKAALNAGEYVFSGQGITVDPARNVALDAGSYTVNGQSITANYVSGAPAVEVFMPGISPGIQQGDNGAEFSGGDDVNYYEIKKRKLREKQIQEDQDVLSVIMSAVTEEML